MTTRHLFIVFLLLLLPVSALAGIDGVQTDTQGEIIYKLSRAVDGVVMTLQQGPTEDATTVKLQIKDAAGNVVATISADGTITIKGLTIQ